ncbi:MAG: hypothetical protein FIB00_16735 [Chloroflexi bacterium]|nr:hypothetical protein [Chloroflexota bacterium]PWB43385.1 MAG: hypothetical protein C3F10_11915 [Dehalococcoidia bacterium]
MELFTIRAGGFSANVDGCARGEKELWFLSMLGHQQAVRAIWARLVKGEAAYLENHDLGGESLPLAREAWGTWRFSGMRLPSGASYHGLLIPELAVYNSDRSDFLLLVREQDDAAHLHYRFLARRLDLPLHPSWAQWLWNRALTSGEVEELDSLGLRAWRCRPNQSAMRDDIGDAVRRRELGVESETASAIERKAA